VSDDALSETGVEEAVICFVAIDKYQGMSEDCLNTMEIETNPSYINNYSAISTLLQPLSFSAANLTNAVFAANVLYFGLLAPKRTPIYPGICTMDYHCNDRGNCDSSFGIQRCTCQQGYQGTYCDFYERELADLQDVATNIITTLHDKYSNKFEIESFDIIMIMSVLRGVTKTPDLITDDMFEKVVQLLSLASDATLYAHWPLTDNVEIMVLESLNLLILKLNHAYKSNRAYEDTSGLGNGQSLE